MSGFSHFAVQDMLHDTLAGDATLMAQVSGVYDHVPPKTAYPYITVGDLRATDISTVEARITRMEAVLHLYSRKRGRKETSDLMAKLHDLLHDAAPAMVDYTVIGIRYTGSEIGLERDGLTYHARMRFSIIVQHN